jgi:hypothetical protein
MKKFILLINLCLCSAVTYADETIELCRKMQQNYLSCDDIKKHADYFGFHSAKAYLHFASNLGRLNADITVAGIQPIGQDEVLESILQQRQGSEPLTASQQAELQEHLQQRKAKYAAFLGVPVEQVDEKIIQYMAYADLRSPAALASMNSDTDKGEIDIIEINAEQIKQLRQDGGGSLEFGLQLRLPQIAASAGIGQYQPFMVHFSGTNNTQKWKYNDFSGAWPVSPVQPCTTCAIMIPPPSH